MWIALTSLEPFNIATIGLSTAVEKLVHPSIVTSAEVLELFRLVESFIQEVLLSCVHHIIGRSILGSHKKVLCGPTHVHTNRCW